jgi:hypothetical protein
VERALRLCRELATHGLSHLSLIWHLPSADLCAQADEPAAAFRRAVRTRIERFGDGVWPMGLTGAHNTPLHVAEIESEIAWATTNIWNTGVRDAMHLDPSLVVPRAPDVVRAAAGEAYARSPVPVGLLGFAQDGLWLTVMRAGEGSQKPGRTTGRTLGALPIVDLGASVQTDIGRRTLLREIQRRQRTARAAINDTRPVVVRCGLTSAGDLGRVLAVLTAAGELAGRPSWAIAAPETCEYSGRGPDLIAQDTAPLGPAAIARAAELRRRRSSKINTRRVLEQIAGAEDRSDATEHADRAADPPAEGRREFVASMMGEASIPGSAVTTDFAGGRLCGFRGASGTAYALEPSENLLVTRDRRVATDTIESCFSFESEISRGLRSESTLSAPEGGASARIRTEFSVVGDIDALVVSQHVFIEAEEADARRGTLFVLARPVQRRDELAVTGRFTDGTSYDHDVTWKRDELILWGEAFQIWDGDSRYTFVPLGPGGHVRPWSIAVLARPEPRVALGGSYAIHGRAEHHLSFLLVRGELDHDIVTKALAGRLPAAIRKEIAAGSGTERSMSRLSQPERREA